LVDETAFFQVSSTAAHLFVLGSERLAVNEKKASDSTPFPTFGMREARRCVNRRSNPATTGASDDWIKWFLYFRKGFIAIF
jgi:hypothetical protein